MSKRKYTPSSTSYIVSDSDILGGKPVIKGTRIPISRILFLLKDGYTLDGIAEDYPWVKKSLIEKVVDQIIKDYDKSPNAQKIHQIQTAFR